MTTTKYINIYTYAFNNNIIIIIKFNTQLNMLSFNFKVHILKFLLIFKRRAIYFLFICVFWVLSYSRRSYIVVNKRAE